jgi:hypothetical protein
MISIIRKTQREREKKGRVGLIAEKDEQLSFII